MHLRLGFLFCMLLIQIHWNYFLLCIKIRIVVHIYFMFFFSFSKSSNRAIKDSTPTVFMCVFVVGGFVCGVCVLWNIISYILLHAMHHQLCLAKIYVCDSVLSGRFLFMPAVHLVFAASCCQCLDLLFLARVYFWI